MSDGFAEVKLPENPFRVTTADGGDILPEGLEPELREALQASINGVMLSSLTKDALDRITELTRQRKWLLDFLVGSGYPFIWREGEGAPDFPVELRDFVVRRWAERENKDFRDVKIEIAEITGWDPAE